MTRLHSSDLVQFARKYRFVGGKLTRLGLRNRRGSTTVVAVILVRPATRDLAHVPKPVRLKLEITGVEEYRFQKRPTMAAGKMSDLKFGYFNGVYFINFDAWGLPAGEVPGVHDFRASDFYVAGNDLFWEEMAAEKSATDKK